MSFFAILTIGLITCRRVIIQMSGGRQWHLFSYTNRISKRERTTKINEMLLWECNIKWKVCYSSSENRKKSHWNSSQITWADSN